MWQLRKCPDKYREKYVTLLFSKVWHDFPPIPYFCLSTRDFPRNRHVSLLSHFWAKNLWQRLKSTDFACTSSFSAGNEGRVKAHQRAYMRPIRDHQETFSPRLQPSQIIENEHSFAWNLPEIGFRRKKWDKSVTKVRHRKILLKRPIYKGFYPILTPLVALLVTLFDFKSVTRFWPMKRPEKAHQRASHGSKYSHRKTSRPACHAPLRGCREHPQSNGACR